MSCPTDYSPLRCRARKIGVELRCCQLLFWLIVRRVGNADRMAKKKMASEQGARNFMTEHNRPFTSASSALAVVSFPAAGAP